MRHSMVFLLFVMLPIAARGATVVKFGATLCADGQQLLNGKCVDKVRETCPSGYYKTPIDTVTFAAPSRELQSCMNSYHDMEMPEFIHPIYNGVLVNFGPSLCGPDEQFGSGACQPRIQGRCESGFYQTSINANTFAAPSTELDECMNSYRKYTLPDTLSAIYNGVLVNFGATLCAPGQYLSNGTCVTREQGTCPENFVDVTPLDTMMVPRQDAQCATGYKSFWLTANCASGQAQSGVCATLCDAGETYTGTGACALACSVNPGRTVTLNALGEIALPLYASRVTTPSLGVATSDGGVCYGNLLPGTMRGTINVTVSDQNYHITD